MLTFKYKCENICDYDFSDKNTKYIIPHICNDSNMMGSGLALALAKKWPVVKQIYHDWANDDDEATKTNIPFKLGRVQYVRATDNITVVNMIAQSDCGGYSPKNGPHLPPIRYQSLVECLYRLKDAMISSAKQPYEVVTGLIGCDRAGGNPLQIKKIVWQVFNDFPQEEFVWNWLSFDQSQLDDFSKISVFSQGE